MKKYSKYIIIFAIIILIILLSIMFFNKKDSIDYDIIKINNDNYLILQQNDKYGVIDNKAKQIIPANYEKVIIPNPEKDVFICIDEKGKSFAYDSNGKELLKSYKNVNAISLRNIDSKYIYEKSTLVYESDGKFGLVNLDGKKITSPIYDSIETLPNKEGELLVKQDNKYGVININGYKLVPCKYFDISIDQYFQEEDEFRYSGYIVRVKTDEGFRFGYYNYRGQKILDPEFTQIERLACGTKDNAYLKISSGRQTGLYENSKCVISNKFKNINYDYQSKLLLVENKNNVGVYNLSGNEILPCIYYQVKTSSKCIYAQEKETSNYTIYDLNGNQIEEDVNYYITETPNENISIKIDYQDDYKYKLIDNNSKELTKGYSYLSYLIDDKFRANLDSKIGIIDSNDNVILDFENSNIKLIENSNLIEVKKNNEKVITIYNKEFEEIASGLNADYIVDNGYLITNKEDSNKVYIDLQKCSIVDNTKVYPNNKIYGFYKNGKFGFKDKTGNTIIEPIYDNIEEINLHGYGGICKDNKWGIIDENGNIILEPVYIINSNRPYFLDKYYKANYSIGDIVFTNKIIEEN